MAGRKSIGDATAKSFIKVKALLKERGITVESIDGPSQDDKDLRFLQELQAIEQALENSATAGNVSPLVPGDSVYSDLGSNDVAKPSPSKPGKGV